MIRGQLSRALAGVALLVAGHTAALAQTTVPPPADDRVIGWASLGFAPHLGGDLTSASSTVVDGRTVALDESSWGDRYDPAASWQFGLAFPVTADSYVYGSTTWERAEADPADGGQAQGAPITVLFGNYRAWALEGGYRYLFSLESPRLRPFVTGGLGLKLVDSVALSLSAPVGLALNDLPAYDDSWVWQWRLGGGVMGDLTDRVGWQVTLDLTYTSALEPAPANTGLPRINGPGGRWMLPIMAGVFYRF